MCDSEGIILFIGIILMIASIDISINEGYLMLVNSLFICLGGLIVVLIFWMKENKRGI